MTVKGKLVVRGGGQGTGDRGALEVPRPQAPGPRPPTGFTLVEVMIVAVIFLIIAGALLTVFLSGRTSYLSSDAYVLVQQEARRGFDVMVRELREARVSATSPGTPTQLNFQIAMSYDSGAGGIQWGDTAVGQWVHYGLAGPAGNARQLVRCVDTNEAGAIPANGAGCRVLANYVDTATFAYDATDRIVTVNLRIQYNNPALPTGSHATPAMTSRVKLRNTS